jgi:hypothetical protein
LEAHQARGCRDGFLGGLIRGTNCIGLVKKNGLVEGKMFTGKPIYQPIHCLMGKSMENHPIKTIENPLF